MLSVAVDTFYQLDVHVQIKCHNKFEFVNEEVYLMTSYFKNSH